MSREGGRSRPQWFFACLLAVLAMAQVDCGGDKPPEEPPQAPQAVVAQTAPGTRNNDAFSVEAHGPRP